MKTLGLALLWIVAFGLALWLLLRARRGKPVVLKGTMAPRFARMIVVILLALGVSAQTGDAGEPNDKPAKGEPAAKPAPAPTVLNMELMSRMRRAAHFHDAFRKGYASWRLAKQGAVAPGTGKLGLPPRFTTLLLEEFQAGPAAPSTKSAGQVLAALTDAEKRGFIGHLTVGIVWRWSASVPAPANAKEQAQLIELFDRLHQHAKLANALIKANADVKPIGIPPRAWASKAGPKRELIVREHKIQKALLAALRKHYATADAAPWSTEAGIVLHVPEGAPAVTVRRGEQVLAVAPGKSVVIDRLSLIDTRTNPKVLLEHKHMGRVTLPGGQLIGVQALPTYVLGETRQRVDAAVLKALLGDDPLDAALIETTLPFSYRAVQRALAERPDAKGADRLRTILHAFTD